MRKILALLALCLVAGLAGTACNSPFQTNAATVGNVTISQSELDSVVAHLASTPSFLCIYTGAYTSPALVRGVGSNAYDISFVDFVLGNLIDADVYGNVVKGFHMSITNRVLAQTRKQFVQSIQASSRCPTPSATVLDQFGATFSKAYLQEQAALAVLQASKVPVASFFSAVRSQSSTVWVNSAYGSWTFNQQSGGVMRAPSGPPSGVLLNPGAIAGSPLTAPSTTATPSGSPSGTSPTTSPATSG